ncbi:aminopeptidase P family protein [Frigoriflavimonas asaccharolytica]|uniref:Xaa-Pro aminopeptidase n=1 Tax=Frigoriflavimonas asaccharolytica TaxID=2735899 RepID=A0A8J8K7K4_9FLAO|nr:aminopeptidase P family protein [Frigoriflavimonas asaccharolytica]NRS91576.1 Xaa-Pro aminopeptidase [Frigoriflavimonas asaccharolytica]
MTSAEKISLLRQKMTENNINAFIVYSADPHMSEYLPAEWQERTWLSGFTGSAGFVVITKENAGLWTDGRYFVQAPKELAGSGIDLFKDGMDGTPNYIDWIISEIPENGTVAVNAIATSHANWELLSEKLNSKNRKLVDLPLLKEIWKDRNSNLQKNPIYTQPIERAGKSVADKLNDIRNEMLVLDASIHIISSLDDVAWTLNLRGSDVQSNPVFLAYIILTKNETKLFVDVEKLDVDARKQLDDAWVKVFPYEYFEKDLKNYSNEKVLISPNSNQSIFENLKENNTFIKAPVPGNLMKAIKNDTELEGFRIVMQRDGVAMVKFLHWLTKNVGNETMNEFSIGEKLRGFRAEGKNFVGESFGSIVGFKENGAIMHYSAPEIGSKEVTKEDTILVDSGGQYLEGTTDITRTFALATASEQFKIDCTLALKGMIQLSMVKFPKGTRGVQLDAFARMALWKEGKDYNHGTGHGVGSFMNVHEGPQNIRKDMNNQELIPGMVLSNEPGFYYNDHYGIRHENLIAVRKVETTDFGTFYDFETLTICPFDRNVLALEIMTESEIQWLNNYHNWCQEKLENSLEGEVKEWFLEQVKAI